MKHMYFRSIRNITIAIAFAILAISNLSAMKGIKDIHYNQLSPRQQKDFLYAYHWVENLEDQFTRTDKILTQIMNQTHLENRDEPYKQVVAQLKNERIELATLITGFKNAMAFMLDNPNNTTAVLRRETNSTTPGRLIFEVKEGYNPQDIQLQKLVAQVEQPVLPVQPSNSDDLLTHPIVPVIPNQTSESKVDQAAKQSPTSVVNAEPEITPITITTSTATKEDVIEQLKEKETTSKTQPEPAQPATTNNETKKETEKRLIFKIQEPTPEDLTPQENRPEDPVSPNKKQPKKQQKLKRKQKKQEKQKTDQKVVITTSKEPEVVIATAKEPSVEDLISLLKCDTLELDAVTKTIAKLEEMADSKNSEASQFLYKFYSENHTYAYGNIKQDLNKMLHYTTENKANAYRDLGKLLAKEDKHEEACEHFSQAIERKAKITNDERWIMIKTFFRAHQFDKANAQAAEMSDTNLELWILGAKALYENNYENNIDDAIKFFEQLFSLKDTPKPQKDTLIDFDQVINKIIEYMQYMPYQQQAHISALLIRIGLVMGFDGMKIDGKPVDGKQFITDFIKEGPKVYDPSVLFMFGYLYNRKLNDPESSLKCLTSCTSLICADPSGTKEYLLADEVYQELKILTKSLELKYETFVFECTEYNLSPDELTLGQIIGCYGICQLLIKSHKITELLEWYTCADELFLTLRSNTAVNSNLTDILKKTKVQVDNMIRFELEQVDIIISIEQATAETIKNKEFLLACLVIGSGSGTPNDLSTLEQVKEYYQTFYSATDNGTKCMENKLFAYVFYAYAWYLRNYYPKNRTGELSDSTKKLILNLDEKALEICPTAKLFMVSLGIDIINFKIPNCKDKKTETKGATKLLESAKNSTIALSWLAVIYSEASPVKDIITPNEKISVQYIRKALDLGSEQAAIKLINYYISKPTVETSTAITPDEFESYIKAAKTLTPDDVLEYFARFHYVNKMYDRVVKELEGSENSSTRPNAQVFKQILLLARAQNALASKNYKDLKKYISEYFKCLDLEDLKEESDPNYKYKTYDWYNELTSNMLSQCLLNPNLTLERLIENISADAKKRNAKRQAAKDSAPISKKK